MSIAKIMEEKLNKHFAPLHLKIVNDSSKHAGHLPEDLDESHLGFLIVSAKFEGMSRVDRSREVYNVLSEEIPKIHAVTALKTLTPAEFEKLKAV